MWALAAGLPKFVVVLASIITVIGFVLPLRKLSRRPSRPPVATTASPSGGDDGPPPLLLDLADPTSLRLANAYRALLRDAMVDDDDLTAAAVAAGHQAVCEAAQLVQGRPPANLAELDQLDRRSEAMEHLRAALRREQRAGGRAARRHVGGTAGDLEGAPATNGPGDADDAGALDGPGTSATSETEGSAVTGPPTLTAIERLDALRAELDATP